MNDALDQDRLGGCGHSVCQLLSRPAYPRIFWSLDCVHQRRGRCTLGESRLHLIIQASSSLFERASCSRHVQRTPQRKTHLEEILIANPSKSLYIHLYIHPLEWTAEHLGPLELHALPAAIVSCGEQVCADRVSLVLHGIEWIDILGAAAAIQDSKKRW